MNKTKFNYWVDMVIAVGFLGCGISGLVLYFGDSAGSSALGLTFRTWNDLHTWTGFVMIAGVAVHLVLHWSWLVAMTKRMWFPRRAGARPLPAAPGASCSQGTMVNTRVQGDVGRRLARRRFLALGGSAGATVMLAAIACCVFGPPRRELDGGAEPSAAIGASVGRATAGTTGAPAVTETTVEGLPMPQPAATTAVTLTVACRKGWLNDPYPGRCRDYVDLDGDGFCDKSIAGSGPNPVRNG